MDANQTTFDAIDQKVYDLATQWNIPESRVRGKMTQQRQDGTVVYKFTNLDTGETVTSKFKLGGPANTWKSASIKQAEHYGGYGGNDAERESNPAERLIARGRKSREVFDALDPESQWVAREMYDKGYRYLATVQDPDGNTDYDPVFAKTMYELTALLRDPSALAEFRPTGIAVLEDVLGQPESMMPDAGIADWSPKQADTQRLVDMIRPGDRVTIVDRFGQQRSGRAVMRSSDGGWTLNMGGRHGTPGLAHDDNIVKVTPGKNRGYNPIEPGPRGGQGCGKLSGRRKVGAESSTIHNLGVGAGEAARQVGEGVGRAVQYGQDVAQSVKAILPSAAAGFDVGRELGSGRVDPISGSDRIEDEFRDMGALRSPTAYDVGRAGGAVVHDAFQGFQQGMGQAPRAGDWAGWATGDALDHPAEGGRGKTSRFRETIAVRRHNGQDIGTVASLDEAKALARQDAEYRPRERYGFKVSRLIRQGRTLKQGSSTRDYLYDPATDRLVAAQQLHPDRQPRRVKTAYQGDDDWAFLDPEAPEGLRASEAHDTDGENLLQDPQDERFQTGGLDSEQDTVEPLDFTDNIMMDDLEVEPPELKSSIPGEPSMFGFTDVSPADPIVESTPETVVVIRQAPDSVFSSDQHVDSLEDRIKSHVSDREDLEDQVREIKDQVDELVDLAESRGLNVMSDDEISNEVGMPSSPVAAPPTPNPGIDQPLPVNPGASPVRQGLVPEQVNETNAPVLTQRGV
jgi:hypothetical protein